MSKYTIIDKYPKGNKHNCISKIQYQVAGYGTAVFEIQLIYIDIPSEGQSRYVFLSDRVGEHIDSNEDKDVFLQELAIYQKGGSYRKTHPVVKSQSMLLRDKKRKLEEELSDLDRKIREAEDIERQQKFKSYKEDIDYATLLDYTNRLADAINSNDRYYVKPIMHIWDGYKLEIWDKQLDKPVSMGIVEGNKIKFRDLDDYEIKM